MPTSIILATLACSVAVGGSSGSIDSSKLEFESLGHFPSVEGTNLEGERFKLPCDFKGSLNVVLVAFQRERQNDVDTWTPFLNTLADGRSDLRIYELPTLARRYRLIRPYIDGGMRRGIPDRTVRAATITLYIDKTPFREALRLPDEERIYVLLVDREGRVLWRSEGRFTESAGAELKRFYDEEVDAAAAD